MKTDQDTPLTDAETLFRVLEEFRKENDALVQRFSSSVTAILDEADRRFAVLAKADPGADEPPWVRYQGRYAKGLEKMIRASFAELLSRQQAHNTLTYNLLASKTNEAMLSILSALRTAGEKPVVTAGASVVTSGK